MFGNLVLHKVETSSRGKEAGDMDGARDENGR